jgi:methyl halide transferase
MNEEQSPSQRWEQRYVQRHTPWDRGRPSPALIHWLEHERLPEGRVLIPGCGYGHEVMELCRRGYSVTAIDIAPSALADLESRLSRLGLEAEVVCADWFRWEPQTPFDAIYEQTSLCSLPPHRWRDYAARLGQWLRPGGLLFALFMQTGEAGGPPWHCDPVAMRRLFVPSAWRWIETSDQPVAHPAGFHELPAILEQAGRSSEYPADSGR